MPTKDEADVPNASLRKTEKQRMMETNFLFDIDEESSMNSSSTMSTHTSFQRDLLCVGKLGLAKPFPYGKIEPVQEENPFEVLHSLSVKKKKALPLKLEGRPYEPSKSLLPFKGSSSPQDEVSHATRETEMTLTESSSEESPWHDFASNDCSENPFHEETSLIFPTQEAKRVVATTSSCHAVVVSPPNMKDWEPNPQNFAKYSAMMIRGHSVAEVTRIMAQDRVHPSIISLVMIAASERQQ